METSIRNRTAAAALAILSAGAGSLLAQEGDVDRRRVLGLTLGDALSLTLENNLDLAVEEVALDVALADARGTWGAFDPVLGVTARYSQAEQPQANIFFSQGAPSIEDEQLGLDTSLDLPLTTGGSFRLEFSETRTDTTSPGITQAFSDGTYSNAVLGAGYTQPLLRGAWQRAATADQREAELAAKAQLARLGTLRDSKLAEVANAYWDLVAAREEAGVRRRALELAREQLGQNRERLRVGVGTEVDVLQAETQVAQEEERLLRADSSVLDRSDALKRLILRRGEDGVDSGPEAWDEYLELWNLPVEPLTPLPETSRVRPPEGADADWRALLDEAFERRSELHQALLEIDRAEVRIDRAASNALPGLDLELSARSVSIEDRALDALETVGDLTFMTYSGSLGFSLPLGNRAAGYAERSARHGLRSARLALERTQADVLAELRSAVRSLETEALAVGAAAKSRQFTQRQLEAEQARYQEGLATTFQVLEFQQQLAEAQSAEKAALAGYAKARVALERARGAIIDQVTESAQGDGN